MSVCDERVLGTKLLVRYRVSWDLQHCFNSDTMNQSNPPSHGSVPTGTSAKGINLEDVARDGGRIDCMAMGATLAVLHHPPRNSVPAHENREPHLSRPTRTRRAYHSRKLPHRTEAHQHATDGVSLPTAQSFLCHEVTNPTSRKEIHT